MERSFGGDGAFHLSSILSKSYEEIMRTATPCPSRPLGFTLIELLVVIAVIAILAGLVLQTAGYAQKKAARSRAEAEIAALSAALENYKSDIGDYPKLTNGSSSGSNTPGTSQLYILRGALAPTSGKVYFEFTKGMGGSPSYSTSTNQPILDPFGEGYGYIYPGSSTRSGPNFFDLWSRAGTTNTNQWIKNW
jgi:prepilin-type N-terminal cleavage/methylation domain-containing protein